MNTRGTATTADGSPRRRHLRVLLAKTGLDGHDRGMKVVAMFLRDAGMDVVLLGLHRTTESIVRAVIDEDVDVIGLSSLGGTHLAHARDLVDRLRAEGLAQIPVVIGGTIPAEDLPTLEKIGVRAVFRPGSLRNEIVDTIERLGRANA
jgi:methylmalonyl-CoA mutase C-terminal domain/subunit